MPNFKKQQRRVPPSPLRLLTACNHPLPKFSIVTIFGGPRSETFSLRYIEKLFHLLSKTSGDAHTIVSKAPLTNEGFVSAWRSLTDRFKNRRLLVNSQLKILFNIHAPLLRVRRRAERTTRQYPKLPHLDSLLVYMISSKLPKLPLSLWEQSIHNKANISTWKELDAFLTERHRTLEAIDYATPAGSGHFQPRSATKSTP
ncbi:hypothetical protein KR038_008132, partial [Drosophila bunnanda]